MVETAVTPGVTPAQVVPDQRRVTETYASPSAH